MIQKQERLILSFHSTTGAMEAEQLFREHHEKGRLIPLPREISAGCGLAWMGDIPDRERLLALAKSKSLAIQGVYELFL